jgi:hypothetical protein
MTDPRIITWVDNCLHEWTTPYAGTGRNAPDTWTHVCERPADHDGPHRCTACPEETE